MKPGITPGFLFSRASGEKNPEADPGGFCLFLYADSDTPQAELHGGIGSTEFGGHHIDKAAQRHFFGVVLRLVCVDYSPSQRFNALLWHQ
ncbi:hypothetical protein [Caballeronia mineralivorans]|uniref:hypothetical protein n=1 Tax=Caballeronia mineralivorans TaxID=2010198 RepID=UPI0023F4B26C|nr:hypothetical protein [Caballeronia mineralivorans]